MENEESKFLYSRQFIRQKLIKGKLFCDLCGTEFTSIHHFFIKIDDANKELVCVPCLNKKNGIDPEEISKAERAKYGLTANIPRIKKKNALKSEKIKKSTSINKDDNQASLF